MEAVAVINRIMIKKTYLAYFILSFITSFLYAQTTKKEDLSYKKRVLESTEVDFLASYYSQQGNNASVTGGIGTEELTDIAPTIIISMPLNPDDVLTIDVGISTYSSASSSNLDPFDASGASVAGDDDGDMILSPESVQGSPWVASSGPSKQDTWVSISSAYSHSSDDRNTITGFHASFATEWDYISFGFGGQLTKRFNDKNTELGISAQVYLDKWLPEYPTELDTYYEVDGDIDTGFFKGLPIYNQSVVLISKDGNPNTNWNVDHFSLIQNKSRNSYAASISLSQIINKRAQFSIMLDLVQQQGWLANPMQRVYFKDKANYYVGNASSIPNYTSKTNTDVFQLADDIERLPSSRFKIPLGARFNYYINETFVLRSYYRFYTDNWGVSSNTAYVELPIKFLNKFTLYPSVRYYTQTQADYFAPFETHQSSQKYYTSDYDLSEFSASQYGLGLNYTDIFTKAHLWKFGLKSLDIKYNYYERNTGLKAHLYSFGCKFVMD